MQHISRFALVLVLALSTCLGAIGLVGCGGGSAASSGAATTQAASEQSASADAAASNAADDADDEEQDNCYGDDLPAKRS